MLAVSGNADSSMPAIGQTSVSPTVIHIGSVCLDGVGCADDGDGGPADPRLGAQLSLAVDPSTGGLEIAYTSDIGGEPIVRLVAENCGERVLVFASHPLPSCR